ncbi:uncharacterized protein Dmoj_GI14136, isoform C [Drosophila mojavensis]|uniref:Uncharacterized protein, isoform C n=1 Tax=Drosophila mojavensis TaxID=7230 RepID=A0A0Q9XIM0_DROMO|nr:uncharacterized protein Dmoj_GI14136, isoform C [Drosophila mojavensis]
MKDRKKKMLLRLALLTSFCFCVARAVLNGNDVNRRETGLDLYGSPPRPTPHFSHTLHQVPHREYGVPQQIPFRDYSLPILKYGPPKLDNFGGGSGLSTNGLHEQIKTHFGVPKPFYGPPHSQYRPTTEYGIPQKAPHYGSPPKSFPQLLKIQHRPVPQYAAPPKHKFFTRPVSPQLLPVSHSAQLFNPSHHPATSYGPPASGPSNLPAKPAYETPPNYGPPPLPINVPGPQSTDFSHAPATTIILNNSGVQQLSSDPIDSPFKQVEIQIDASGHTHSVTGSQTPFHTACDGWKPIPTPIGTYIEKNHIVTQSGYSHVDQGHIIGSQYNFGRANSAKTVNGISDEQLVAVALQGESGNIVTGPTSDGNLSTVDSEALQVFAGANDTYSKPPADSYQPGSIYDTKYKAVAGESRPLPHIFGPAYGVSPQQQLFADAFPQSQALSHSHYNSNMLYGTHSGNPKSYRGHPKSPVAFRPPVPTGLIESIGATVQHLDELGVKPPSQAPTYIPPATHEIPLNSADSALLPAYGAPFNRLASSQVIMQQQLPQPYQGPIFAPLDIQSLPSLHYIPSPQQQRAPEQYFSDRPSPNIHLPSQQSISNNVIPQNMPSVFYSQALPLIQQIDRFNQQTSVSVGRHPYQHHQTQIVLHDCGQGPNLISSSGYQVHQQQQFGSVSTESPSVYNAIEQSVPVAEQHTQFLAGAADSYGPPSSGNEIELDHFGYESQKSAVTALPDGTDLQQLPGLNELNVISAQKSQDIKFGASNGQPLQNFQIQFGSSVNNGGINQGNDGNIDDPSATHVDILSQGLLQSILTAIEQPQSASSVPQSHNAQSRSDDQYQENEKKRDIGHNPQTNQHHNTPESVELQILPDTDIKNTKDNEMVPIVAADVEERSKH